MSKTEHTKLAAKQYQHYCATCGSGEFLVANLERLERSRVSMLKCISCGNIEDVW